MRCGWEMKTKAVETRRCRDREASPASAEAGYNKRQTGAEFLQFAKKKDVEGERRGANPRGEAAQVVVSATKRRKTLIATRGFNGCGAGVRNATTPRLMLRPQFLNARDLLPTA